MLGLTLGRDIEVTRTEVRIPAGEEAWQERLLDILVKLGERVSLMNVAS